MSLTPAEEEHAMRSVYEPALREAIADAWATRHTLPWWSEMRLRLAHRYRDILRGVNHG